MEQHAFRVIRSSIVALIMFFALRTLGFGPGLAMIGALVPFLLGTVDIMAGTAFSITGFVLIFAVAVALFPTQFLTIKKMVSIGMDQATTQTITSEESQSPSPTTSTNAAVSDTSTNAAVSSKK